ncbi:ATP-grasp domain-containing protein [Bacillus cereus]|uniref:ATP-grasp domain-containing protein n=1 Tax=Bacillus cereus TaxID=1396 RepID=UPI00130442F4|nr:ATP-grasp domain-containing protein [Bacillus cereus]
MKLLMLFSRKNTHLLDLAYQHAIKKGHEVYTVNTYKEKNPYEGKSNSKIFSDPNLFIAIAQVLHVDAVVCFSTERTLERDALIKKELENKGITVIANPLEVIKTLAYKEEAKNFFFQNEIPTAQGSVVKNKHELEVLVKSLGFPVITKRSRFSGGKGNKILKDYDDLYAFVNGRNDFGEKIVVEKFVHGIELSMEIVGNNNSYIYMPLIYKGITSINDEHPTERVTYAPYDEGEIKEAIKNIAFKIAKGLNLCGCAELELVWDPHVNAMYVLEMNPRINGNTLMGMAHTNVSIPKVFIDMADNTWNNSLDFVSTDRFSISIDLKPGLSKSVINKVYSLPTFFKGRFNKEGQCIKFLLSGKTNDVMEDIEKIIALKVSSRLKNNSDFQDLLQSQLLDKESLVKI